MSTLERQAIQRLADRVVAAGMEVPAEVTRLLSCGEGSTGAKIWAAQHPDEDPNPGCCYSSLTNGPAYCICWVPVFDVEQAQPRPPSGPDDLKAQPRMCGDCAYRRNSPERSTGWEAEALMELATNPTTPFFCHAGMRLPVKYVHPDGREVPGDPADYQPPRVNGLPYQIDGSPGLLCAGWATRAVRATAEVEA